VTNNGTFPIGLTTTKREIIDFRRFSPNVSDIASTFENLLYRKLIAAFAKEHESKGYNNRLLRLLPLYPKSAGLGLE
jgi:hypothetical protein